MRLLRNQGMERQYENEVVGFNNRMTDIHAAIGRVQLTKVDGWTAHAPGERGLPDGQPARASRPRRSPTAPCTSTTSTRSGSPTDRDGFAAALREEHGVGTGVYYPIPNHRLPSFAHATLDLPETEQAAREVLSLPVHPSLTAGRPRAHRRRPSTRVAKAGA